MESVELLKHDMRLMAQNWRDGYKSWLSDGDNAYVFAEFYNEIHEIAFPFIKRLMESEAITASDASEIQDYFYSALGELRDYATETFS